MVISWTAKWLAHSFLQSQDLSIMCLFLLLAKKWDTEICPCYFPFISLHAQADWKEGNLELSPSNSLLGCHNVSLVSPFWQYLVWAEWDGSACTLCTLQDKFIYFCLQLRTATWHSLIPLVIAWAQWFLLLLTCSTAGGIAADLDLLFLAQRTEELRRCMCLTTQTSIL